MKITIHIHPNAKQEKIVERPDATLEVWVRARAKEGEANKRLIELLAEHFDVAKTTIIIERGHRSRTKQISVDSQE